ncbi:MAG: DUF4465 domain-containing protein [Desulfobacteraceae bacterium]|nr:DUF4465 domain-containing protein [Desulfobacteraceae bacterium]MBC2756520.1 DUF4465 domain-containing protein [Desulfobacteraceae bacterium]
MKRFTFLVFLFCSFFIIAGGVDAQTADFEDLSLDVESYWNGSDGSGGFVSGGVEFSNNYNSDWFSWDGFAYSNITDTTAEGFGAQYNVITGSGADASEIYSVAYISSFAATPPTISLNEEQVISGAYFTNNNYAFYSMTNGDDFSKKFTDDDWFKLTITGFDADGSETGKVEFNLADGTNIVDTWTWVDLNGLGAVKQLTFGVSSTDNGDFGMNTPAYFCMDNFNKKDSSDDSTCFIHTMKSEFISWQ